LEITLTRPCSLVTGCAGFIGSHVAEALLSRGHDVVGLDDLSGGYLENVPKRVRFTRGSVSDTECVAEIFRSQHIDYVFHLAAYAAEGLSHYIRRFNYQNNLGGSVTLINEAVRSGSVRCFVFTSSIAVYGHCEPPVSEETVTVPADPYGIAKLAVELDLAAAHDLFGLPFIVFRPHNVYGPRQNIWDHSRNVIGIFMRQLLNGEPMTVFGDGRQTRAFTYIDDVVPALVDAVHQPECYNKVFNIGADAPTAVSDVACLTAKALGVAPSIRHLDARPEPVHVFARHDRVRACLGSLPPPTALAEGLARMAVWASSQPPRLPMATPPLELPTDRRSSPTNPAST